MSEEDLKKESEGVEGSSDQGVKDEKNKTKDQSEEIIDQSNSKVSDEPVTQELTIEEKCDQYELGWKRALADYENLKRTMADQQSVARRRMKADFAQSMLGSLDTFEKSLEYAPNTDDLEEALKKQINNWVMGVSMGRDQLVVALEQNGLTRIDNNGGLFNPKEHEAVGTGTEESVDDDVILKEVQSGWKIGDDVIRPMMVIVNKK